MVTETDGVPEGEPTASISFTTSLPWKEKKKKEKKLEYVKREVEYGKIES